MNTQERKQQEHLQQVYTNQSKQIEKETEFNNYQSPSFSFASNKKGLPLFVQREIVHNVKHLKGLDDFVREWLLTVLVS
jgi:hypothetical protein